MLAADVAAVVNAPCAGLIMKTDSNETTRTKNSTDWEQTVCECDFILVCEQSVLLVGAVLSRCTYRPPGTNTVHYMWLYRC